TAMLPTLVPQPLLLGVTVVHENDKYDAMLISQVNADLTIAHQYLARILENTGGQIEALGAPARYRDIMERQEMPPRSLTALLEDTRQHLAFDFLYLTDAEGAVEIGRAHV